MPVQTFLNHYLQMIQLSFCTSMLNVGIKGKLWKSLKEAYVFMVFITNTDSLSSVYCW